MGIGSPPPKRELLERYPRLLEKVPWIELGRFPTAVERLSELEKVVKTKTELWIKRDDRSGEPYGSNKVRKLEILLAEALAGGRRRVLAMGALGSNHVLACLIYANRLSLRGSCVLFPQPMSEKALGNLKLDLILSDHVEAVSSVALVPLALARAVCRDWRRDGILPHIVPVGGSSSKSSLGIANGVLELKRQVRAGEMPEPDLIVIPLGSCGTVAGVVLGVRLAGLSSRVIAVRVVERIVANGWRAARLANGALDILKGVDPGLNLAPFRASDIEVAHDYIGGGYAHWTLKGSAAMGLAEKTHGIPLEGTYTGKALACAIDLARDLSRGKVVLFWNTHSSVYPPEVRSADVVELPLRLRRLVDRCPAAGGASAPCSRETRTLLP